MLHPGLLCSKTHLIGVHELLKQTNENIILLMGISKARMYFSYKCVVLHGGISAFTLRINK